jgi:AcrR family transcriptional regulator
MPATGQIELTRRSQNTADRRATLMAAAARLFVTRGYDGTSIDEIAARAKVSRATVFNYFPTKRSILEEHYIRLAADFLAIVEQATRGTAREGFRRIFKDAEKLFRREGDLFPILYREVFLAPALTSMDASMERRIVSLYAEIVKAGQSAGEIRRGIKPIVATRVILDLWASTLRSWVEAGQRKSLAAELDEKLALVFAGLSRRRSSKSTR